MPSNNKCSCPTCGRSMNEREIVLYAGMVHALWDVYQWCKKQARHEFKKSEVNHLLHKHKSVYANWQYWTWFSGAVYKNDVGFYVLNMERCEQFFAGELKVCTRLWKNPITKELRKEDYRTIRQIPTLSDHLNEEGNYVAQYA